MNDSAETTPSGAIMETTDVYIDFTCPWSYIAHHQLAQADQATGRWQARAYQLNPGIAAQGLARETYRTTKFGTLAESQRRDAVVVHAALAVGLDIDFETIDLTPNTRNAHRAVAAARSRGGDGVVLTEAIFAAYFQDGQDIGDPDTLSEIAQAVGIDISEADLNASTDVDAAVDSDIAAAHRAGLTGVPYFVVSVGGESTPVPAATAVAQLTRSTATEGAIGE